MCSFLQLGAIKSTRTVNQKRNVSEFRCEIKTKRTKDQHFEKSEEKNKT